MLAKLKLIAYGILLPLVIWFAWSFHAKYSFVMEARGEESASISKRSKAVRQETPAAIPAVTLPEATNSLAQTNGVVEGADRRQETGDTNAVPVAPRGPQSQTNGPKRRLMLGSGSL